jgi:hypothetical protein
MLQRLHACLAADVRQARLLLTLCLTMPSPSRVGFFCLFYRSLPSEQLLCAMPPSTFPGAWAHMSCGDNTLLFLWWLYSYMLPPLLLFLSSAFVQSC